jgi:hypothetical protein
MCRGGEGGGRIGLGVRRLVINERERE